MPNKTSAFSMKIYSTSYFLASKVFSKTTRQDIETLYELVREADECVDTKPTDTPKLLHMKMACIDHSIKTDLNSVRCFRTLIQKHKIPSEWVQKFFDVMESDISISRIETYQELEKYMEGSAAVIGYILSKIIRKDEYYHTEAQALGQAFQLTNFLRDIREDYQERGRIYLPKEELHAHNINIPLLLAEKNTASTSWNIFMEFQTQRVLSLYQKSLPGIYAFKTRDAIAILAAHNIYKALLLKIRRNPKKVLQTRLRINFIYKCAMLSKAVIQVLWNKLKNTQ